MSQYKPIIVLDDDPTGTQTVHGIPVLTEWSEDVLRQEFSQRTPLFYILTNSRALHPEEAEQLASQIGKTIKSLNQECWLISRSDSTLRGHFPTEVDALAEGLGWGDDYLTILLPAFFAGNRFTKDDIHYLKEGDTWIPAAETPYAQDKTFGYGNSNLKDWVEEKTKGRIPAFEVDSISIEHLDNEPEAEILARLNKANKVLIVNALTDGHLAKFSGAAMAAKRKMIFRTAASFVASFGRISEKAYLTRSEVLADASQTGGVIVVGSHVPKTTTQLKRLLDSGIARVEFEVEAFLRQDDYLTAVSEKLNELLADNQDVVLFTSRTLVAGADEKDSLAISVLVSAGLIKLVQNLTEPPKFFIAKGGITSSDLATKGLGVKRAMVSGQIAAGIPVWKLGDEAKFPGLSYVVFPGNVGDEGTLREIYEKLR
ncbi:four-carbon acid sugar kinase family protein [Persicitalea jodogahamensis]|uniref:Uncharacterized protein n=1 Tax=Persicitalea jodogahamensis TaxID=402147 RepID=A0A8J3D614_9BACT|nr:four-carbon acid sugar kinase family protein [Persicitalea jodogahamensis]GHB80214.1 hypothetical protein GCM10007390_38050 [Persicitalea jodogahamensis]